MGNNLLHQPILGHLPKTSYQVVSPPNTNKKIEPKPEKDKHPSRNSRKEKRFSCTLNRQLTTKGFSSRRALTEFLAHRLGCQHSCMQ